MLVLALLVAIVVVPLSSEYRELRRSLGLSRLRALGTTALVLPTFAVALMLALPLSSHPPVQWLATVAGTLLLYSLAARAIADSASEAETAPSRSTRG
jgi:hypothetical protein